MARAGFGGSGDYGSFFGSLYNSNRDQQRAQQDAADQDAMDKWQNGLMSDQEWIQYMQGRVEAYAGDPKRQQNWVNYLRKYSSVIADNQAEFAYKNGDTSISDLIAHYQDRVAHMDGASAESRDMQLRINDLMDQRSVDQIQTGAEAIQKQIEAGDASYNDLLTFLKGKLPETRSNSDLRDSLQKQIDSTRETIRTNKVEGTFERLQYSYDKGSLSAGAYANRLRQLAEPFKQSDPKRYYQILQAAVQLSKSGGGSGGSGGSRGGSSGGGSGHASPSQYQRQLDHIDTAMAERNNLQALVEQYENGAKVGIDPRTGAQVVFSDAKVRQLDRQLLAAYDGLATAYRRKGDKSAATGIETQKARYISSNLVKHNTLAATEAENELMRTTQARVSAALEEPDPTKAMGALRLVAADWRNFAKGLTTVTTKSQQIPGRGEPGPATETHPKGILSTVDPEFVSTAQDLSEALTTLTTPGLTDEQASSALDTISSKYGGQVGSSMNALLKPVLQVHANEQGLATGELQRVVTGKGIEYARTQEITSSALVNGAVVPTKTRVPVLSGVTIDGQNNRLVDVFVDINGQPTKMSAVATRDDVGGMNSWYASKQIKLEDGTVIPPGWVTAEQIDKMGDGKFQSLASAGKIGLKPSVSYWKVNVPGGTDANGAAKPAATWAMDDQTGMWYRGSLPIRGVQTDAYGAVKVTSASGLAVDYKSFASASGVPAPYEGTNAEKMQLLMDDGLVDTKSIRGRDLLGNVTDNANLQSPYWDGKDSPDPQGGHDTWWKDEQRSARAERAKQDFAAQAGINTRGLGTRVRNIDLLDPSAPKQPSNPGEIIAEKLGINLNGTKPKQAPLPSVINGFSSNPQSGKPLPGLLNGVAPAQKPSFTGPTISAQTGFNLDLPKVQAAHAPVVRTGPAHPRNTGRDALPKSGKKVAPVVTAKPVKTKNELRAPLLGNRTREIL